MFNITAEEKKWLEAKRKIDAGATRVVDMVVPQKEVAAIMKSMDPQSKKLFRACYMYFSKRLKLDDNEERALQKMLNVLHTKPKDEGTLRNVTFHIASELNIDLPSSSF
jgi:hypothetical protein